MQENRALRNIPLKFFELQCLRVKELCHRSWGQVATDLL